MVARLTESEARALRLASMCMRLIAGQRLTAADVARIYGVAIRTANRDIDAVSRMMPTVIDEVPQGGRSGARNRYVLRLFGDATVAAIQVLRMSR